MRAKNNQSKLWSLHKDLCKDGSMSLRNISEFWFTNEFPSSPSALSPLNKLSKWNLIFRILTVTSVLSAFTYSWPFFMYFEPFSFILNLIFSIKWKRRTQDLIHWFTEANKNAYQDLLSHFLDLSDLRFPKPCQGCSHQTHQL